VAFAMGAFRPGTALTFDDVLLVPRHSSVHPRNVDVRSRFTRGIPLNLPLVSAAMDTVTESEMAMAIAREGGIGVIHKNMPIDRQAAEVDRVKRSESGMILHPITLGPDRPLREAVRLMERFRISGVPVVDDAGRLVGIITNRDLQFERELDRPIRAAMTQERLVTAPVGTTLEEAERLLAKHRIEKLRSSTSRASSGASSPSRTSSNAGGTPMPTRTSTAACGWRRRWGARPTRCRGRACWLTPAATCSWWTRRTVTPKACSTPWRACARRFPTLNSWVATWRARWGRARWASAASTP